MWLRNWKQKVLATTEESQKGVIKTWSRRSTPDQNTPAVQWQQVHPSICDRVYGHWVSLPYAQLPKDTWAKVATKIRLLLQVTWVKVKPVTGNQKQNYNAAEANL